MPKEPKDNVKLLHKGIKIEKEPLQPVESVVKAVEELFNKAKTGEITCIIYSAMGDDGLLHMNIIGKVADPMAMQVSLKFLEDEFYSSATWPMLTGGIIDEYE